MLKIVFATGNKNKIKEVAGLIETNIKILSLEDVNIFTDFEETGTTFEENSKGKALFYSQFTDLPVIADDSGLEIDYLAGEPGVYSARYLKPDMTYPERCKIILDKMKNVEKKQRTARFKCVACCAVKSQIIEYCEGVVNGEISIDIQGNGGFGYDPIFFYPPFNKTFANASLKEKNSISHRFFAFSKLFKSLEGKLK